MTGQEKTASAYQSVTTEQFRQNLRPPWSTADSGYNGHVFIYDRDGDPIGGNEDDFPPGFAQWLIRYVNSEPDASSKAVTLALVEVHDRILAGIKPAVDESADPEQIAYEHGRVDAAALVRTMIEEGPR
jgi:hypothetical protein